MSKVRSPGEEHRRLAALAGEWSGEEQLAPSPWSAGGQALAKVSARMALNGYYLEQDYIEQVDGRTSIEVRAVFAWDEEQRHYLLYWFDSYGFAPQEPGSGHWQQDGLVLTRRSSRGMTRHRYGFEGSDCYRLRLESSFDGGHSWSPVMDGVYRRV